MNIMKLPTNITLGHCSNSRTAPPFQDEADLIAEALVREIASAQRWSAVVDAWNALLRVRHMSRQMLEELDKLESSPQGTALDRIERKEQT